MLLKARERLKFLVQFHRWLVSSNMALNILSTAMSILSTNNYLFTVNNRASYWICSKLTIKASQGRHRRYFVAFIVKSEHVLYFALIFLLLTWNKNFFAGQVNISRKTTSWWLFLLLFGCIFSHEIWIWLNLLQIYCQNILTIFCKYYYVFLFE